MNDKSLKLLEYDKIIMKLADLTSSDMGRNKALELMPAGDAGTASQRLECTSDGVRFILKRGAPSLRGLHDIRSETARARLGSSLTPGELLRISAVLNVCRTLKNTVAGDNADERQPDHVDSLLSGLASNAGLETNIKDAILSEEEIADTASPALRDIRRKIRDRQNDIRDRLGDVIRSPGHQKHIQESIVTVRGGRYVIPVKVEFRNEIPGVVHDMSSSGATVFIEPMAVVEANNDIRELTVKERLEIEKILAELTQDVAEFADRLDVDIEILGELDFIFAKAKLSLDYKCTCPSINEEGFIEIKNGRHPGIDKDKVVPVDISAGKSFRTLVITGPNTGGKTVALKTLGLFALMSAAGLHLPADEGTSSAVFNEVLADIGDEQSIEQSLSTFSSHMKNIVEILAKAGSGSLVMLDELGAGTDPTEGAALAMAILEHLKLSGAVTAATTHYSEIKVYAAVTEGVENACCEFDVKTLRPLYKLLTGIPGRSNAFAISERLGLDPFIIGKAKEFLTHEDIRFEDMLASIEKKRQEAENDRLSIRDMKAEIAALKEGLHEKNRETEQRAQEKLRESAAKAGRILAEARREAEFIIAGLKKLERDKEQQNIAHAAQELKQRLRSKITETKAYLWEGNQAGPDGYEEDEDYNGNYMPGETVFIKDIGKKGTVLGEADKNGQIPVQAGIMKISVPVASLRHVSETGKGNGRDGYGHDAANVKKAPAGTGLSGAETRAVPLELDVRGLTVDEAVELIDRHIDSSSLAGLREVFVIHGKGTGALRAGIHRYLSKNTGISSYRLGAIGEGDAGVTVIKIR
ncbi:MAG: endonuclease MutS2 [Eubacteriales bacterium]|nr:endonuclease MutS2 [Eubacteriales bacterium]